MKEYQFRYKNDAVMYNAHHVPWHPILLDYYSWFVDEVCIPLITSSWRSAKIHDNDSGIAMVSPLRHLDFRSKLFAYPKGVVDKVNAHWVYDPNRPEKKVCIYHDSGQGLHLHNQVHPNTVRVQ